MIANQNYISPRYPNEVLVHPHDDATLLENSLEEIGFKVIRLFDLTKREMETALEGFCKILKSAKGNIFFPIPGPVTKFGALCPTDIIL